jgi:hypothetical protein
MLSLPVIPFAPGHPPFGAIIIIDVVVQQETCRCCCCCFCCCSTGVNDFTSIGIVSSSFGILIINGMRPVLLLTVVPAAREHHLRILATAVGICCSCYSMLCLSLIWLHLIVKVDGRK